MIALTVKKRGKVGIIAKCLSTTVSGSVMYCSYVHLHSTVEVLCIAVMYTELQEGGDFEGRCHVEQHLAGIDWSHRTHKLVADRLPT